MPQVGQGAADLQVHAPKLLEQQGLWDPVGVVEPEILGPREHLVVLGPQLLVLLAAHPVNGLAHQPQDMEIVEHDLVPGVGHPSPHGRDVGPCMSRQIASMPFSSSSAKGRKYSSRLSRRRPSATCSTLLGQVDDAGLQGPGSDPSRARPTPRQWTAPSGPGTGPAAGEYGRRWARRTCPSASTRARGRGRRRDTRRRTEGSAAGSRAHDRRRRRPAPVQEPHLDDDPRTLDSQQTLEVIHGTPRGGGQGTSMDRPYDTTTILGVPTLNPHEPHALTTAASTPSHTETQTGHRPRRAESG